MITYTSTPDFYNDYLMHYGVKGMKWRKHIKGKYYRLKSKVAEGYTKVGRKLNANYQARDISLNYGNKRYTPAWNPRTYAAMRLQNGDSAVKVYDHINSFYKSYDNDPSYKSGRKGARLEEGLAAGRKRAGIKTAERPKSRKKKVVSGTGSIGRK